MSIRSMILHSGAIDPHYDTLSLFSLWLEHSFKFHPFCVDGIKDPIRIKERIHKVFSAVLSDEQFQIRVLGLLGSNST